MALIPRTANPDAPPPAPLPGYLAAKGYTGEGRSLKLKRLLLRHKLTIADLARNITQASGAALSRPATQQLVTYGIFPTKTSFESIRQQVSDWLTAQGVPADEIATAFDLEDTVVELRAHPTDGAGARDVAARLRAAGVDENVIDTTLAAMRYDPARRAERYAATRSPKSTAPTDIDPLEKVMLTPEARKHFALPRDPFKDDVNSADDVYLGADQRHCREAMWQASRTNGFVAIIGESGAGKTVLRHDLLERLARDHEPVVIIQPRVIDKSKLTAALICQAIIRDLDDNAVVPNSLEKQARLVERMLKNSARGGNRHVLIIEEAQDLTKATLKYLKRFWELQDGFRKLLAIILIGQPELNNLLDERYNWDAREVIRRCEVATLMPLHGNAIGAYIEHKFSRIGVDAKKVLAPDAIDAIKLRLTRVNQAKQVDSQLYPLVLNNLLTRAANEAASLGAPNINADVIRSLGAR